MQGHTECVTCVAFNSEGLVLASGSNDRTIRLWGVVSRKELRVLSGHEDWVLSVAFDPCGRRLVSGSQDGKIGLWDVDTGELKLTVNDRDYLHSPLKAGPVTSITHSPGGDCIAWASPVTGHIFLWYVSTGKIVSLTAGPVGETAGPICVAFSPDGLFLAAGCGEGRVFIRDGRCREMLASSQDLRAVISSLAFSPCGQYLAVVGDHAYLLLDSTTCQVVRVIPDVESGNCVSFAPDGRLLAISSGWSIRLWDLEQGHAIAEQGVSSPIQQICFSPDGQYLASAEYDGVKLWRTTDLLRRVSDGQV